MAQQLITTTPPNTQRGDSPKAAFDKVNANFTELYGQGTSGGAAAINFTAPFPGAVTETVAAKLAQTVSVLDFGADPTGATDSAPSIQAAINSGAGAVSIPVGDYTLSSGIIIPPGVIVTGQGMVATPGGVGTVLTFALSVSTCVILGGSGAADGGVGLLNVTVTRAAGASPAGSIGILISGVYNPTLSYINSTRHSIGFEFFSDGISSGISAQPDHLFTGAISDAHLVISTWPELRLTQSRFGQNGSIDVACSTYIRITGGSTVNAASGPNTLFVSNTQFNQGGGATCANWLQFSSLNPGTISDVGEWMFANVHVESTSSAAISTDATWTTLQRLKITNFHYNDILPFLSLNSVTQVGDWEISNSFFAGGFSLATTPQINFLSLANNKFTGAASITGVSNSVVTSAGNTYGGGLTLAGSFALLVSVDVVPSGAFTDTSTAAYKFLANNQTGMVYGSPTGGSKGVGTINAGGLFVNGASVSTTTAANPTASVGLAAVNGTASTFMRSDGAPALSQAIVPIWSGSHIFSGNTIGGIGAALEISNTGDGVNGGSWLMHSQVAGATAPSKFFRITNAGDLQIINNAFTTTILSLTDAGVLTSIGSGLTALNGTNISSGTVAAARLAAVNINASGNGGVTTPLLAGTTAAIGGSALLAGQVAQGTVTIAGATTSMVATASPSSDPDSSLSAGIAIYAFVSAANTVTVRVCAIVAVTPAAVTYNVRVIQ
jgi:hypothetical protein